MKKSFFLIVLMLALGTCVFAQAVQYDPDQYCTGWHNPNNFTYTGGLANTQWQGLTGSKAMTASSCTAGIPLVNDNNTTIVAANNLATISSGSSCYNTGSTDVSGNNDHQKRFVIKGSGTDAETGNRLTYLPATYANSSSPNWSSPQMVPGFTKSIRLGNFCGGGEAEALRYKFEVLPGNALMTIWYALSLYNAGHDAYDNPEFAVMVEIQDPQTNAWQRVGGDTLCYIKPTPTSGSSIVGTEFFYGSNGGQTGSSQNVFTPWNKVTIALYKYLYRTVRITIASGDCAYSAHYACCYIAGDCEPMQLSSSGCSAGENDTVTELTAPDNMLAYQWYKNKTTHVLSNEEAQDLTNLQIIQGATSRTYHARENDFRVYDPINHDSVWLPQTTFVCAMQSLMNRNAPTKRVTSWVNTSVGNSKPSVYIDTLDMLCDGTIMLRDHSVSTYAMTSDEEVDTAWTQWEFYDEPAPLRNAVPLMTATGHNATGQFTTPGTHSVKVKVANHLVDPATNERSCWNMKTIKIRSLARPTVKCVYDSIICSGEEVLFTNQTDQVVNGNTLLAWGANSQNNSTWHLHSVDGRDTTVTSIGYIQPFVITETSDIDLTTRILSQYWLKDTTGDGIPEKIYCDNTGTFHVRVEQFPQLTVTGDTIVCEGQLSTVQVDADVPVNRYKWCTRLDSNSCFQTGQIMQETPQSNKTYYIMAATPNNCISWDSLSIRMVNPVLTVPVTRMCDGDIVYLYGTGASTYTWTPSPFDNSMEVSQYGDTVRVSPTETTTYTMVGHGTNGCNADPKTETIKVYHYPEMKFEMSPTFIDSEEPVVTFSDVSKYAVTSLWDFGNGVTSTQRQLTQTFTSLTEDSIYITLTSGNELNCLSDTAFYVPVNLFAVWFPTAFTPTLSTNRTFKLFTKNDLEYFSIYIYDRRGDLVFYSTDQNFEWDGKHNGRYCDQGSYVYVCNYRRPGTVDIVQRKGTVLMLQ